MDEYIKREDAIDLFWAIDPENDGNDGCMIVLKCGNYDSNEIEAMLSALPAAEVAEVVRCKDCRYYQDAKANKKGFLICPASGMEITETDYCSYGARMDKEAKQDAN